MLAGAAISVIWYAVPALKAMVYEIIPAFAVALALALAGSRPARRTPR
jgi:hypothetical protein